jgi:predicted metalloprotease with PDZ domain
MLDHRVGRLWRPLEDTARSVQILRLAGSAWQNWRRGLDYYSEGTLIWLEVDTKLRQLTHSQKSLDDFCRAFHGGQSGPPRVVPYGVDDVVRTLNDLAAYDWASLLMERTKASLPHAPLEGIGAAGWKLVYTEKPNLFIQATERQRKSLNAFYSLGFGVSDKGVLEDVIPGSPAYNAEIGPGMTLIAVNGRRWSKEVLREALRAAKNNNTPIELLIENRDFFKTYLINYHEGEKYPHLERIESEDLLTKIVAPCAKR